MTSQITPPHDLAGDALCLFFDCKKTASLTNDALELDADHLMTLLSSQTAETRRHRLNQIAVMQLDLHPEQIFQSSCGLPDAHLDRLFHGKGRLNLVNQLVHIARPATQPTDASNTNGAYIVVASGRRVGKTTLIQMLKKQLSRLNDRPFVLDFDFSDIPGNIFANISPALQYNALLRWFLQKTAKELKQHGETLHDSWTQLDNAGQRNEATRQFEQRLDDARKRRGCPVFLFDETHYLVEKDAQLAEPYTLFRYLRGLISAGRLILIATTVPFRTPASATIWELRNDPHTPFHNTGHAEFLAPWQPDETWDFIHDQLFSFGITVPPDLKLEILTLCRGVASIAQRICQRICEETRQNQHVSLPTGTWYRIQQDIIQEIRDILFHQIAGAATQNDADCKIDHENNPTYSLAADNRLWQALLAQARQAGYVTLPPDISTDWPAASSFTLDQLYGTLQRKFDQERLQVVLSLLTGSSVLTQGTGAESDHYVFQCDLIHHCIDYEKR